MGGRAFLRGHRYGVAQRRCAPHRPTGLESPAMARTNTHLLNGGPWGYSLGRR